MSNIPLNAPRGFKKPTSTASLDKGFLSWSSNYKKLFMDLGCGAGLHPIQLAKAYPDSGVIAIERTTNKFLSMQRRIQNHYLENIYSINEDAIHWLPTNLADKSVDKAYFLYPNPYPKEKQANKRWHRQSFFESILSKIKKGGLLTFATNEEWLHKECEDYMTNHWGLNLLSKQNIAPSSPPRTHFEKKYLLRGESCFNLEFIKE